MPDRRGRPLRCSQTVQHFRQRAGIKRHGFGQGTVSPALVSFEAAHEPSRVCVSGGALLRFETSCPIGGGGVEGGGGLLSPPLGGFLSLMV